MLRGGDADLRDHRVVAMPTLEGPQISGVPTDPHGFIPVSAYGEVPGLEGVYAAGDVTTHPIKHGGLAAQQADVVASAIAWRAGAGAEPLPVAPVIRGSLITGRGTRLLEAVLGDDGVYHSTATDGGASNAPVKIAAKHLGPYLAEGERDAVTTAR
jgi:sulfide:quinone oxidoreductase